GSRAKPKAATSGSTGLHGGNRRLQRLSRPADGDAGALGLALLAVSGPDRDLGAGAFQQRAGDEEAQAHAALAGGDGGGDRGRRRAAAAPGGARGGGDLGGQGAAGLGLGAAGHIGLAQARQNLGGEAGAVVQDVDLDPAGVDHGGQPHLAGGEVGGVLDQGGQAVDDLGQAADPRHGV